MKPLRSPLPTSPVGCFIRGMSYPWRALNFMRQHHLWRLGLLPALINSVLLVVVALTVWWQMLPLAQQLHDYLQTMADDGEVVRMALQFFSFFMWLVLMPVALVVAVVLMLLFGQTLAAPWLDILAERVENLLLGQDHTPYSLRRFIDSMFLALGDMLAGLTYLFLIYVPVFLLTLIPGLGALLALGCGALFLAHQFCAHTMSRKLLGFRARWQAILINKWLCLGFGCVAVLLVSVPVLNFVTLPLCTVAGTLLCCDLVEAGRLRQP
ncbi:MAG: hypothetical protein EOO40_10425 [Deltaproteobacteria bacterium]|nr:MAG: hypothetical protein EOO40_10425 [Deltaproteobacteria bacterium]